ncbi:MAG TPA: hypothetical protein VGM39_19515 [Kofleriaceae bacterium]|jgi:hypothetical protein
MNLGERAALLASVVIGVVVGSSLAWRATTTRVQQTAVASPPTAVFVPGPMLVVTPSHPPPGDQVYADPSCGELSVELARDLAWSIRSGGGLFVAYQRGVRFVHSDVEVTPGDPVPSWDRAEAKLACGSEASWLVASLVDDLRWFGPITCCDGTCSYGRPHDLAGTLTFVRSDFADGNMDHEWDLTAWTHWDPDAAEPAQIAAQIAAGRQKLAGLRCREALGVR